MSEPNALTRPVGANLPGPRRTIAAALLVVFASTTTGALAGCGTEWNDAHPKAPVVPIGATPVAIASLVKPGQPIDEVGLDITPSDHDEQDTLLSFVPANVVPIAVKTKALVLMDLVGANGFNDGQHLGHVDFADVNSSDTQTPEDVTIGDTKTVVNTLTNAVPPTPQNASDPIGFLRRLQETKSQMPGHPVVGFYLGDGGQTANCDLRTADLATGDGIEAAAVACLADAPLNLSGVDVNLLGIGVAGPNGGGMSEARALQVENFFKYVVTASGGRVTGLASAPVPGAGIAQ